MSSSTSVVNQLNYLKSGTLALMPTNNGGKMKRTAKEIQNESNIKALKRARVALALGRKELAQRLDVTPKAIEKYENGRDILSEARLQKILKALEITPEQFFKIKKGKNFRPAKKREKKVLTNKDRRSYQKNITKECKVLRSMRRMKKISQDEASNLCGYSRTTIGHIENGRIELSRSRIEHILRCYGYEYSEFRENMSKEELRDVIVDKVMVKLYELDGDNLSLVNKLISNFK